MHYKVNPDLATKIVSDYNETLEFCKRVNEGGVYYTYRPLVGLLQHRSHMTNEVMYHRSHQPEY